MKKLLKMMIAVAVMSGMAYGQGSATWINETTGWLENPSDWSIGGGAIPDSSYVVNFAPVNKDIVVHSADDMTVWGINVGGENSSVLFGLGTDVKFHANYGISIGAVGNLFVSLTNGTMSAGQAMTVGSASKVPNSDTVVLEVYDGGTVTAPTVNIGDGGSGHRLVVSGEDSLLETASWISIGTAADNCVATVTNGGRVIGAQGIRLGVDGSQNRILVTGTNSLLRSAKTVYPTPALVIRGSHNEIRVEDGGVLHTDNLSDSGPNIGLFNGFVEIGNGAAGGTAGCNNRIIIGEGGIYSNRLRIALGVSGGTNNEIVVEDGGFLYSWSGYDQTIGSSGNYNRFLIKNGGEMLMAHGSISAGSGGTVGNVIRVEGEGSILTSEGTVAGTGIYIGSGSVSNRLEIVDGGKAYCRLFAFGAGNGSENRIWVTGTDS